MICYECIVIEERKAECCGVEDQNALEYEEIKLMSVIRKKKTEIIEEKVESCRIKGKKDELIEKLMPSIVKNDVEITDDKKVEDIRMSKS